MKTRLLAIVTLFLICRSKALLHDPPQVYFKIYVYVYIYIYNLFI